MKWSDEYATGIERIDEQHKTIFNMIGDYRIALEEEKGEESYVILLDFLDRYTRAHFGYEERCMEEYRCPAAAKNKEAHARFVEVIADFRHRFATASYRIQDAQELVDFLERWFAGHVLGTDRTLKEYVPLPDPDR